MSERPIGDHDPRVTPEQRPLFSVASARAYVEGTLAKDKPVVHEGHKSRTYECERTVDPQVLPDKVDALLYYRYFLEQTRPDLVMFLYALRGEDGPEGRLADMHLAAMKPNQFELVHRYVQPKLRRAGGVGSRLLHRAEEWVQQVARESRQDAEITFGAGQNSVFKWAMKNGYVVSDQSRELWEELQQHPERFKEDEVIISDESRESGIKKDVYLFRVGTEGRYMEDAIRIRFAKVIPWQA